MQDGRTRVVLISGRWTRDLVPLTGLRRAPEIWGSHGWERLFPDGRYETATPDETALRGLAEADTWIEEIIALGGRTEQKPSGLAIHWRGLGRENAERIRRTVRENWALLTQETGLALHDFDGGIELRVPGRDKGHALSTVLAEMPASTVAAYLGDDLTDEDAFHAIRGKGLGILVRDELRITAADMWLTAPRELMEFLTQWRLSRKNMGAENEMA
jgi:trehalose-phosphatase